MITAQLSDFRLEELPDECPDWSYLEQAEFEDRLQEFHDGDFCFVGVRASVEIKIPHGQGTVITHRITSPGLWGIESDSGEEYFRQVFQEESKVLASMLAELGVQVSGSGSSDRR